MKYDTERPDPIFVTQIFLYYPSFITQSIFIIFIFYQATYSHTHLVFLKDLDDLGCILMLFLE